MMKKLVLFVLLSSLLGFSQEKVTTQDFGLNPKTKTVVSKQTWTNVNYSKGIYIETLTFNNNNLQSKKNQDGEYVTINKYFYDNDNKLIRIETFYENSKQTEMVKFIYQNGKIYSKEFYMNDKLVTNTAFTYDKNGRLINETEKSLKNELVSVVDYSNYVNDNTYTKSSVDYNDKKILQKIVEYYVNGLVSVEESYTNNIRTTRKLVYSSNRRLVKEIINNNDMNVYSYKFDENGNPIKIFKMNNNDKGDFTIIIQNTYSEFND